MNQALGIIPVRYESTRFPGKPLAMIGDRPMILWVVDACKRSRSLSHTVIATDDERIYEVVQNSGADAIMTSRDHKTGTDRLVEAAAKFPDYEIIVNIQGDEPGIEPDLIDGVIDMKRKHPDWEMSTAARRGRPGEDLQSPHRVKVVLSKTGRALYFSRSLIPFPNQKESSPPPLVHLGIYAFNKNYLLDYNNLSSSRLEQTETLEQLRALENDGTIGVHVVEDSMTGVDTPEDLEFVISEFRRRGVLP